MKLSEEDMEDITDMVIDSRDVEDEETADEMFKKLGYEKYKYLEHIDYFQEKTDKIISFRNDKNIGLINAYDGFEYITMQELKAINKKVEELGWR